MASETRMVCKSEVVMHGIHVHVTRAHLISYAVGVRSKLWSYVSMMLIEERLRMAMGLYSTPFGTHIIIMYILELRW